MTEDPDGERGRLAERVMMGIIAAVPGFTPPAQARSREVTFAIVSVTKSLLKHQSYDSIKMQDIAEKAGCAVPAIYARFSNKSSLLAAVNLLSLEGYRSFIHREFTAEKLRASGFRGLISALVELNDRYHKENHNFVVATAIESNRTGYRLISLVLTDYAACISEIASQLTGEPVEELLPSIRLALRTLLSLYRDSALGIEYLPRPSVANLVEIFCMIVERRLVE